MVKSIHCVSNLDLLKYSLPPYFVGSQYHLSGFSEIGVLESRDLQTDGVIIAGKASDVIGAIGDLKIPNREIPILAIAFNTSTLDLARALRSVGANAYLPMAQSSRDKVLLALDGIIGQEFYIGHRGDLSSREILSPRELQVYSLIAEGLKTSQIAKDLHVSIKTIEAHCDNMKQKLQMSNILELRTAAMGTPLLHKPKHADANS